MGADVHGVDEAKEDGPDGCATGRIFGGAMVVTGSGTWRIRPVG
jgi:hypothetical protein